MDVMDKVIEKQNKGHDSRWAKKQLLKGETITRKKWEFEKYIVLPDGAESFAIIKIHKMNDDWNVYEINNEDAFANDWQLYEKQKSCLGCKNLFILYDSEGGFIKTNIFYCIDRQLKNEHAEKPAILLTPTYIGDDQFKLIPIDQCPLNKDK